MKSAKSIRKKLIAGSMIVLVATLAGFLAAVIWINTSLAQRQKQAAFASIRNGLLAKGNILVSNNGQALQGMAADNAFLAVAGLVASTVRDDEDVIYGIFMDDRRQPWVMADSAHPEGTVDAAAALDDSISLWASRVDTVAHRRVHTPGGDLIEFVAPVVCDGRKLGVVRYGFTTARMNKALAAASHDSRQALLRTIAAMVSLGGLAGLFAYLAAGRQAGRITRPIEELQGAANAIARGDYARAVSIASDDEIGLLAADFDSMRITVKEYTERLEEMVADKIREIKDILDSIEQGLFTVGLDGRVNPDYALSTNMILDVEDVSKCDLAGLFRLEPSREADWMDWLDMVRQRHSALRWEKLVRLSPVRELRLPDGGAGERTILVGYQKMFDRQGNLSKLMVLVQDVTDARRVERMIKEEKERHEHQVKAILGIVRYSAFIPDFLEEVSARLRALAAAIQRAPSAQAGPLAELEAAVSRDLHTLKGTAATYGFQSLSGLAREAEEYLEEMRRPNHPPLSNEWAVMAGLADRMEESLAEVRGLADSILGGSDAAVSIPRQRIRELRALALILEEPAASPDALARLLRACRTLDHVRLDKLADKYRTMLQRVGERLGKRLEFRAVPEDLEVPPGLFAALDTPLVHLLRNAADHGIEMEATRLLHGKPGVGRIQLAFNRGESGWEISVSDDGDGIDVEALARKAAAKGLVDTERLASMDEAAKRELIFLPGLSSRDHSTEISGMGIGMDAVAAWAGRAAGEVSVESRAGQGTRITLRLPKAFTGEV